MADIKLSIEEFLEKTKKYPVVDVRTPAEFDQGHIPGAYNIPLLSNEERAVVGTLYKQEGKEKAFLKALEFVGPKMVKFVKKAKEITGSYDTDRILLYCWRGGMRSGSMGWLFNSAGLTANTLEGGYKNFRKHIRDVFSKPAKVVVLGGYTGSGKTDILKQIAKSEQVIDLEALAHHKGSAFGFIGQKKQPSSEHFENILGTKWMKLDFDKEIWLEDESRSIGKVYLPEEIYRKIKNAPVIFIDIPSEVRIERLVKEYANFEDKYIEYALEKIKKRIGGLNFKIANQALKDKDYKKVAEIALIYYDKAYKYGVDKREKGSVHKLDIALDEPKEAGKRIIEFYNEFKKR